MKYITNSEAETEKIGERLGESIIKEKKRGVKCIGCPYAGQCANRSKCSNGESKSFTEM